MAHNAPRTSSQKRYISKHAVERARERATFAQHLDDIDVTRLVDDAVDAAMKDAGKIDAVLDEEGALAKLVDISKDLDGSLCSGTVFALVKDNLRRENYREAVVTIVGDKAAASIREQSKGKEPFNPLAAKLASVDVTVTAPEPVVEQIKRGELTGMSVAGPKLDPRDPRWDEPDPEPDAPNVGDERLYLLTGSGGAIIDSDLTEDEARERLDELVRSGKRPRLWVEVPVNIEVKVTF